MPEADHKEFRRHWRIRTAGNLDHDPAALNPLEFLDEKLSVYIEDRRRGPRGDALSDLAAARHPNRSTTAVVEIVRSATYLLGAGQETTAKLRIISLPFRLDQVS